MKLSNIFKTRFGHLRAGWRILIWLAFVLVCFIPVAGILKIWDLFSPKTGETTYSGQINSLVSIVFYLGLSTALILGSWLTLYKIDKRPYELLGFDFKWSALGDYFSGFALAFLNFIPIYLIMVASGLIDITFSSISILTLKNVLIYFIAFSAAAIFEELFSRGYLFQALMEGSGPWFATGIISVGFVAGHATNAGFDWNNALFFFVHSVLYCILYLKTRSVWVTSGFHAAWNLIQGSVFGMNVSGITIDNTIFISESKGPLLLTGGEFGIEGSLISVAVSSILIVLIIKSNWLKPSVIRSELWKKYSHIQGTGGSEKSKKLLFQ